MDGSHMRGMVDMTCGHMSGPPHQHTERVRPFLDVDETRKQV